MSNVQDYKPKKTEVLIEMVVESITVIIRYIANFIKSAIAVNAAPYVLPSSIKMGIQGEKDRDGRPLLDAIKDRDGNSGMLGIAMGLSVGILILGLQVFAYIYLAVHGRPEALWFPFAFNALSGGYELTKFYYKHTENKLKERNTEAQVKGGAETELEPIESVASIIARESSAEPEPTGVLDSIDDSGPSQDIGEEAEPRAQSDSDEGSELSRAIESSNDIEASADSMPADELAPAENLEAGVGLEAISTMESSDESEPFTGLDSAEVLESSEDPTATSDDSSAPGHESESNEEPEPSPASESESNEVSEPAEVLDLAAEFPDLEVTADGSESEEENSPSSLEANLESRRSGQEPASEEE